MADPKWADVANYYLKSGIYGMASLNGSKRDPLYMPMGSRDIEDFPPRVFVPILRHRDDMTEADEVAAFEYVEQREWPEKWPKITKSLMISRSFNMDDPKAARLFLWLISRGFDVFGLIESGQAIRKEVGNG